MPEVPKYYLGADPGEKGGIAVIDDAADCVLLRKMPETAAELLQLVRSITFPIAKAGLERIDPRPTTFMMQGKWVRSILRSTCIIYGDYLQLHMALLACDIDPLIIGPYDWQKGLGIEKRRKGETKTQFKGRLKLEAMSLFPNEKVTLAVADALLIAYYVRKMSNGL